MIKTILSLFLLLPAFFLSPPSAAQEAHELTRKMFAKTRQVSTLKYQMNKWERIDGKMIEQRSFTKLNRFPLKVYVKQLYPNKGVEVLYRHNDSDKTALVNPNGFPWFNLRLDPMGSTMRKDQHHTLLNAGFDHVVNILEFLFNKYGDEIENMVHLMDEEKLNGRDCWVIKLKNPNFTFYQYTLQEGENIDSLARRLMLSQHMIIEINDNVNNVDDVSPGKVITLPSDYSPEMILYIDKALMVPAVMKVYDLQGLYEHYEYINVEINPTLTDEEFSPDFDEYGF